MRKFLFLPFLLLASAAWAQPITDPAPAGIAGAYNSSPPTCTNGQFCFLQTDAAGALITSPSSTGGTQQVVGNVASAATDSGNPVKIGAIYNTTTPTFTNGQRGNLQIGSRGSLNVTLFGADGATPFLLSNNNSDAVAAGTANKISTVNYNYVFNGTTYDRMRGDTTGTYTVPQASAAAGAAAFLNVPAGQATTVVKASAGRLYTITFNSAATATNTTVIYDNATGVGTIIASPAVTAVTAPTTLNFGPTGLAFANGLTIITAVANGGDMTVIYK